MPRPDENLVTIILSRIGRQDFIRAVRHSGGDLERSGLERIARGVGHVGVPDNV